MLPFLSDIYPLTVLFEEAIVLGLCFLSILLEMFFIRNYIPVPFF